MSATFPATSARRCTRLIATTLSSYAGRRSPGTVCEVVIPELERLTGKKAGVGFGVCNNPEFLREGTAIYDYHQSPKNRGRQTDARSAI